MIAPKGDDLLYIVCQGLERGSWEWWLKGCYIFDPLTAAAMSFAASTLLAGLTKWLVGKHAA